MQLSGKMCSPITLFNLAKKKIMSVYKDHWTETNVLPKVIQRDLLEEWLKCDELLSLEPATLFADMKWHQLQPITPQVFIWLMTHPQEVPYFANEHNHIIFDYYIQSDYNNLNIKRLCGNCFPRMSKYYEPCSANYWLEKNLLYKHYKSHRIIHGDELLESIIWEGNNWCDECTCTPLFNILDYWDCDAEFDYHRYKKSKYQYDSSDSDNEEDREISSEKIVSGNRLTPDRYVTYVKHGIFQ